METLLRWKVFNRLNTDYYSATAAGQMVMDRLPYHLGENLAPLGGFLVFNSRQAADEFAFAVGGVVLKVIVADPVKLPEFFPGKGINLWPGNFREAQILWQNEGEYSRRWPSGSEAYRRLTIIQEP